MFRFQQFFYILFLVTILGSSSLFAQAAEKINPDELPALPLPEGNDAVCRCVTTFMPDKNKFYYLKIGSAYHVAPLNGENISIDLPVRGERKFVLFEKTTTEDGSEAYLPAVTVPLEGTGKRFLVVLRKPKGKPITGIAHNLSTASFPASQIYLLNESSATLGLQINTSKATVQPFKKFNYNFRNTDRNTYTSAKIVMRYQGENKIMASKRLRLVPGRRIILVCFASQSRVALGSTPLRMVSYQDMPK